MRKLFIILFAFFSLAGYSQGLLLRTRGGKILSFQGKTLADTTADTTTTITSIGDGIDIGDGIEIGDGAYSVDIIYHDQYMRKEETEKEIIS